MVRGFKELGERKGPNLGGRERENGLDPLENDFESLCVSKNFFNF